jgi:hypothetical protein
MGRNWNRASRVLALFLVSALMQVYVLAGPAGAPLLGRLTVYGEGGVSLNGNTALTGTTVFSGARLRTSDKAGALVLLSSAGKLEIAPNTDLSLTFDHSQVSVQVISGDAILSTSEGVKGSLTTPDGKVAMTDGASASSLGGAGEQQNNRTRKPCKIGRLPCALFWVLVDGGLGVAAYFALREGNNSSPSTP